MKITIEKLPVTPLEHKSLLKIKDPFVMGIYTFAMMEMDKGQYTVRAIIDTMIEHFEIKEQKIMKALKVIVDELGLIEMTN